MTYIVVNKFKDFNMIYIGNAFSLQMLKQNCKMAITSADINEVRQEIANNEFTSCIGHENLACVAGQALGGLSVDRLFHRIDICLLPGDTLYVCQLIGGRLKKDCTKLPKDVKFVWKKVIIEE